MDVIYKKIEQELLKEKPNEIIDQLVKLSNEWVLEKCSPSYKENDEDYYLGKELFIAEKDNEIIAYALGEIKVLKEETSYNLVGEKAFELDELYVTKEYRNMNIGSQLFKYLEDTIRDSVDLIGVIATSSMYEDLLRFYIKDLELEFNHALLVKRT